MNGYFIGIYQALWNRLRGGSGLVMTIVGLSLAAPVAAHAYIPGGVTKESYTSITAAPGGFWVQVNGENGQPSETRYIGTAPWYPSVPETGNIASVPGEKKYWIVTPNGYIHNRGEARALCEWKLSNCSGFPASPADNERVVAVTAHPNGRGIWALDKKGRVWTAGETVSYGDVQGDSGTPVAIHATPSGNGYYIAMHDGGVHTRGDAVFYGSTGGNYTIGNPFTGMALSYDAGGSVNGYWLVESDGGVHTFGHAMFLGSTGGNAGRGNVASIATSGDRRSYAWVYRDGRVEHSNHYPRVVIKSEKWAGTAIDVLDQSLEQGAPLIVAPTSGSESQLWDVWPATHSGDMVQLRNVASGMCLDLSGGVASERIIQWPCKPRFEGWTNQLWFPTQDGLGVTEFRSQIFPTNVLYVGDFGGDLQVRLAPEVHLDDPPVWRWRLEGN